MARPALAIRGGPGREASVEGVDGRRYPIHVEDELNLLAARVLGTPDGIQLMNYLRGITLNTAFAGDIQPNALLHMEGQRWLVGMLASRIKKGNKP